MGLSDLPPAILKVNNQSALSIVANPVLHEKMKLVEIYCHFFRDKINSGDIKTTHVPSYTQVPDILTKSLSVKQHYYILDKFEASTKHSSQFEGE